MDVLTAVTYCKVSISLSPRLNSSHLERLEQCPEEAEEKDFYRHCAVRSADMQTWVCISFLLVPIDISYTPLQNEVW